MRIKFSCKLVSGITFGPDLKTLVVTTGKAAIDLRTGAQIGAQQSEYAGEVFLVTGLQLKGYPGYKVDLPSFEEKKSCSSFKSSSTSSSNAYC